MNFSVDVVPSAPGLVAPANGSTVTSPSPTLQVTGGTDVDGVAPESYRYEVGTNASFTGATCESDGGASIALTQIDAECADPDVIQNGRTLYWRVRAENDVYLSDYSSVAAFTWQAPAPAPTLRTPVNGSTVPTVTPVLGINPPTYLDDRAAPVSYDFQVARDPGFTTDLRETTIATLNPALSVPVDWLTNDTTYYWRVRGKNAFGPSSWSSTFSFSTKKPHLGSDGPMWDAGAQSVNMKTGNLTFGIGGPSYASALRTMSFGLVYNSRDSKNVGFGPGISFSLGDDGGLPLRLTPGQDLMAGGAAWSPSDPIAVDYGEGQLAYFLPSGDRLSYSPPGDDTSSVITRNADGSGFVLKEGDEVFTFGPLAGDTAPLVRAETVAGDANKGATRYAFSGSPAKPSLITDPAGRTLSFNWAGSGCPALLCITGPDGVQWRYIGDGPGGTSGNLKEVHNGTRAILALGWTSDRVTTIRDANDLDPSGAGPGYDADHKLQVTYDGSGNVASLEDGPVTGQDPATASTTFGYHPGSVAITPTRAAHEGGGPGTARNAAGYGAVTSPREQGKPDPKQTRLYYDDLGQVVEQRSPLGRVTSTGYNRDGTVAWTEDPDGNPTDSTYDSLERVLLTSTGPDSDGAGPLERPVTTNRYDEAAPGDAEDPGPALVGLHGSYYANRDLAGRPTLQRLDANIDVDWANGSPDPSIPVDNFSVRWTGSIDVPATDTYVFRSVADDGVRLSIDGYLVLNRWDYALDGIQSLDIPLTEGRHRIELTYREFGGAAQVHLWWKRGGGSFEIVPQAALAPAYMNPTSTVSPSGRVSFSRFPEPWTHKAQYDLVHADGQNVITSYEYDAYGRNTRKVMPKGNAGRTVNSTTGALSGSPDLDYATDWTYYDLPPQTSAAPNPAEAEKDPAVAACSISGGTINQAGLLEQKAVHGMAAEGYVYDASGRARALTEGRGTTCSTYDNEGRLTSQTTKAGTGSAETTSYTYDPAGQALTTATPGRGTLTSEYDEAGRVVRTTDSLGTAPPAPPGTADDQAPPVVTMLTPTDAAEVSGDAVSVAATASDDVDVVGVQFTLDGNPLGPEDPRPPYRVVWDTTSIPDGTHTLRAVARDAEDNTTTSDPVSVTVANEPDLPEGLVAAYGFDEGTGSVARDASGNGNTGAINGATWTGSGKHGGALDFDGTNDLVTVADDDSLDLTDGLTFSAWVKPGTTSGWQTVGMKEESGSFAWALYGNTSSSKYQAELGTQVDDYLTNGTPQLATGTWVHLAVTYDGSTLRLFKDGIQASSVAASGDIRISNGALAIGGNTMWGEYFDGLIDDVRLYDHALTAGEITTDMNTPVPAGRVSTPTTEGLVAAYGFDEGTGSVARDASGNGNTGAINGATWTGSGKHGGALDFDGTNDLVTVADDDSLDLTDGLTFSAWVKPGTTSGWQTVGMKEESGSFAWALYGNTSSSKYQAELGTQVDDYLTNGTPQLATGTWVHLAVTYDGSTLRLFKDGIQASSVAASGDIRISNGALAIGGNTMWGEYFDGLIDDVRLYDHALTAGEITTDMALGVTQGENHATIPGGDGATEARFVYDQEGNILTRHAAPGAISAGQAHWVCFTYDAEGNPTRMAGPLTGTPQTTCPTGTGDQYAFHYDTTGRLKAIQYPDSAAFSWRDYDHAGNLTALYNRHGQLPGPLPANVPADAQGSPIADYAYTYDIEGRKTQEELTYDENGSQTRTYDYDEAGRLSGYTAPDGALTSYTYDLDSNRTRIERAPQGGPTTTVAIYSYTPTAVDNDGVDQLVKVTEGGTTTRFHYTPDGDLAERRNDATNALTTSMAWDGTGLSTGGTFDGTQVTYTLDPAGRQKSRGSNGRTLEYLYTGDTPLFERRGGTVTSTTIDGPEPLADYAGAGPSGDKQLIFFNGHGDTAATTDAAGDRQGPILTGDPFGVPDQAPPADTTTERYTGKWHKKLDTTSALVQMGVRLYDPALGRFLSVDPVDGGSANNYDYALQNPVNVYDLDGRWAFLLGPAAQLVRVGTPILARYVARRVLRRAAAANRGTLAQMGPRIGNSGLYHGDLLTLGTAAKRVREVAGGYTEARALFLTLTRGRPARWTSAAGGKSWKANTSVGERVNLRWSVGHDQWVVEYHSGLRNYKFHFK
ncbi:MAG: LamG-like jellyroll fold domain-containing protein [Thermoleophilia bacterium]